jgi:ABC-type uncharacterized transport system ATPase subunit
VSTAEGAHLEVNGLTKRFGGLVAVRDMALGVNVGRDRLKLRIIQSEQRVPPIRMP